MRKESKAIIILGATGDLAKRKLIPALNTLFSQGNLSPDSVIIGSGRREITDADFRRRFTLTQPFAERLFYYRGLIGLREFVQTKGSFGRIIVFLALPPETYGATAEQLARGGFGEETLLIIEKPFGRNLETAMALNSSLTVHYRETQIFRSDHYLAKEAVQNLLIFRFANTLFEPAWNNRYVESIQINAFEELGVEERGSYYDSAGSIRDMVQNHLFQLLCLTAMEPPVNIDAEDIRHQKLNILKCLKVEEIRRGQYRGYREEKDIAPDSNTETYVEMKLRIDNNRWAGVPVYIRTGKATNRRGTEIGIRFKPLPKILFNKEGQVTPNRIVIKVQPAEGIILDLSSKIPGMDTTISTTKMAFCYHDSFDQEIPEAYQKLLMDALEGDRTLFVSAEETELSWRVLDPFLDGGDLFYYKRGTCPETLYEDVWLDFDKYKEIC